MRILKLNKNTERPLFLVLYILILLCPVLISPKCNVISVINLNSEDLNLISNLSENEGKIVASQDLDLNKINLDQSNLNDWDKLTLEFDKNNNGLNDQFENYMQLSNTHLDNQINIIIRFPDEFDYSIIASFFEDNGGRIKHTYKYAINGFSGSIGYHDFEVFYNQLKNNNVQFFIEENREINAQLYYASRNLRLRPYVWNTLGYTGDNESSIAILDTGINANHSFFDNVSTGKIVGWRDFTTGGDNSSAYDDNGHGSHCAGIAAGIGNSVLDNQGRTVATSNDIYSRPYIFPDGYSEQFVVARFYVTSPGEIIVACNFTDLKINDDTWGTVYLIHDSTNTGVSYGSTKKNWGYNLTLNPDADKLGIYEVILKLYYHDKTGDSKIYDPEVAFRGEIHWYFNPDPFGSPNYWQGVAPDTNLVGVKVLEEDGVGSTDDIIKGIDWCIANRKTFNITVMSLSLGGDPDDTKFIDAVDKAMRDYGIVTVVAAGNNGTGNDKIGSPGDADYVITVAAMNNKDQIASYSSQGGFSSYGNTTKPDITAPGGSGYDLQIFSADANDNDCENQYPDSYVNDTKPTQGTSMACPAVAGAANLLIQAMRKENEWNWDSGSNSTLVKAILLMTATETYPLKREFYTSYSPTLDRGYKDVHEGYGRLNIDAAIEAWMTNFTSLINSTINVPTILKSSYEDPYGKHAYAGYVCLEKNQLYSFGLSVPAGRDYDLHLYNNTPNAFGEPVMIASSTSSIVGQDEFISYNATHTGKFFIVIKAIGQALPPAEEEDDGKDEWGVINILEFLLSPLGLLIIGTCVAVVIIIVILAKRSSKSGMKEKVKIRQIMDESYY